MKITRRQLKGVSLIGELVALLFMLGAGYFLGGIIIWFKAATLGGAIGPDYNLIVEPGFTPVKHEDMLLSMLETTYPGDPSIKMKDIFAAVASQNSSTVRIGTKTYSVESGVRSIMGTWAGDDPYLLRVHTTSKDVKIVWDTESFKTGRGALRIQKVQVKTFGSGGCAKGACYLELLVRD